jgi:DNA-binding CsgD family transcriptional regulator
MSLRSVVVVHRERMVAEGISAALARYPHIVPIGTLTTASEGGRVGERADAVAIDESLSGAQEVAAHLRRKGVRVVLLGEASDLDEGVKVSTADPVSSLARALVPESRNAPRPRAPARREALTRRETQILELVARGFAGKQVARHLGISPKTVEQHKTHIFAKLGVPNQTAAVGLVLGDGTGGSPWTRSLI